ncbi:MULTISPECIES: HD domain-containing phosphohydrolase [Pseudomonas]|uniref:Chemotaxis protein CheY n=1 Tax=Pseudomonas fluorescens TaxID=294 RepID=A0AAE2AAW5_PSEFL|nr:MULTISPECIES: HD domain-containing phosphohydrolase [Pseudomonas]KIF63066.1 chemotaxis protein CheY [Pseudomonas fluorescens]SCZ20923.1 Response regulator c-di-GMP phosphodiesterase, RpfG family, contains REC and HD-GYP domains [Pseudomonas sp. NFIX46]SDB18002.1 Response regulator c-di-GMP phosphodiesterase, RpfG family, contains REC and HD-GYP domains [Pseudomonas putida]SFQ59704.1 Response regulator c-di-GMP phosphodiesterase, RpfG family, contains REC and HD-GYP domains [Pseudomonas sp. N
MEEPSAPISPPRPKVLLVDDEEPILNSLRRLLRGQPYDVLLATSGAQALEILEQQPVNLVMSDARMPNMDGATLLARVHELYPATARIMLTGYADPSAIIKAINEGQIHRYISKPWNDEEMLLTLRQALEHQHLARERERLEKLTRVQNEQLKLLNSTLEKHVAARTAELQQTADMLDLAYEELKHSYVTGTEVFSLLANLRLPPAKQTNRQIIELVRGYCKVHRLDEAASRDLTMAAALYNIGKLSWTDSMMTTPSDLLHSTERDRYRAYPKQSESLLMTLDPMKDAARLILHHQEHWDGTGFPDRLKGEAIPMGSRLLKLAVDFVELQRGLILERQMNSDEALLYLRQYAGKVYDPELIEDFVKVCATVSDITLTDPSVRVLGTRELAAGMILARNLNADNGMLLLNAGKVLSAPLVEKLISFEAMEGGKYKVFVKVPQEPETTLAAQGG